MTFWKQFAALIREIPADLHRRADHRRTVAWGHQEQLRRAGAPERLVEQQGRMDLALADLTDVFGQTSAEVLAGAQSAAAAIRRAAWRI